MEMHPAVVSEGAVCCPSPRCAKSCWSLQLTIPRQPIRTLLRCSETVQKHKNFWSYTCNVGCGSCCPKPLTCCYPPLYTFFPCREGCGSCGEGGGYSVPSANCCAATTASSAPSAGYARTKEIEQGVVQSAWNNWWQEKTRAAQGAIVPASASIAKPAAK
jgi:hypothetical protein